MKPWQRVFFGLLCVTATFIGPVKSQEKDSSAVTTVTIRPLQVGFFVLDTENHNAFVDNLPREKFRVSEKVPGKDWQTPEVKSVFGGEQPLLLAFALDTSDSVFQSEAGSVKKILQDFVLTAMRPGKDAALLIPFRESVDGRRAFTDNVDTLVGDIKKLSGGGGTALFDALLTAVKRLEEEEEKRGIGEYRKAIILLSDGQENASAIQKERFGGNAVRAHVAKKDLVEYALLGSDIPVYVLYTNHRDSERTPLMMRGVWTSPETSGEWLRNIARNSGGTFFPFMGGRERRMAFKRVTEELTHKFWLLFYAADPVKNE
ncbi:MAG: VWA domain-containing protein, partial [bacterium]|nr:VWA domain-containing protein [bacterium]